MAERRDHNMLAFQIVQQATGQAPSKKRNPKAKARGEARAAALSPEKRSEIAKAAAKKRWAAKDK
jgi:hypothetical protein